MGEATSTFTIRALKEALKWIDPGQTVLLRGRHGIGKSAVAYQAAKIWGLDKVIERRISQLSEGDMIGLPDRSALKEFNGKEWQVTKFLPTDWFLEQEFGPHLVFLDEINRGTPETMQACFQYIEKGELNGRKKHPNTRIIAAINFSKEYQVTPMDPAFVDRFWIADVEPDKEDWLAWARAPKDQDGGGIDPDIIDFIVQCNEDHFEIMPEKLASMSQHDVTPSRRSWERLNRHVTQEINGQRLIELANSSAFYDVCRGFVGPEAARALSKFLVDNGQNVTPEDVIDNFDKVSARIQRLKPETQVALIDKIKHHIKSRNIRITDEQGKNLGKFMRVLPPEIGVTLWNAMAGTTLENATTLHKYIAKFFVATLAETKIGQQLPHLKNLKK